MISSSTTTSTTAAAATSSSEEAERLRLAGNDAFSTKDWKRAVDLYQQSVVALETAKAYNNLATTLCKLSFYEEALAAAKRATELDPIYVKAWYRRGLTSELMKKFPDAIRYYGIASQLDPKDRTCKQRLHDCKKRLGVSDETVNGYRVMDHPKNLEETNEEVPSCKAWKIFQSEHPSVNRMPVVKSMNEDWFLKQTTCPTSKQSFVYGLSSWITGMESALGGLAVGISREAMDGYNHLQSQLRLNTIGQEEFLARTKQLIGGKPTGNNPLEDLSNGFAYLEGKHLVLEIGDQTQPDSVRFCPRPTSLSNVIAYQHIAILNVITKNVDNLKGMLGLNVLKSSGGVLEGVNMFFANIGIPNQTSNLCEQDTPAEAVNFIKHQLQAGKSWDDGLRSYVSLQYRGTILFGAIMRFSGMLPECHEYEKWAEKFIALADEEFKVTEDGSYIEKGSSFRPSLRIGFLSSMLHTHMTLNQGQFLGAYPMADSIDLCLEIISMAADMDDPHISNGENQNIAQRNRSFILDYCVRRRHLALSHSSIAAMLASVRSSTTKPEEFCHVAKRHGFVDSSQDTSCDPFAIIGKQYLKAAQAQIPDASDAAILSSAYGAHIAQASKTSGFILGDLRHAIKQAESCEEARDIYLFGVNLQRGGSYETISKLTARRFAEEDDSFILPQIVLSYESENKQRLILGDEIICDDFENAAGLESNLRNKNRDEYEWMDTSDLEKKHGHDFFSELPSLKTLCVGELHKSGCEFAKGESDPSVIHWKSMMSEASE